MHIPILDDILIIFLLSVIVILIFNKLKIPAIVGYLITGVIAGPYVLKLISSVHEVEMLAEIGIILFLFVIGMEFSISKLMKMKKYIFIGGLLQVVVTIIAFLIISFVYGLSFKVSLLIGFFTALSSTAIVLKILTNKGLIGSPQGNLSLSILIFQDISILPMFLIIPLLSGSNDNISISILFLILKIIGIIIFLFLSVKYLMPFLMDKIAKTRIKELFYISVLLICFGIVWLASLIGISPALGAFLAGLIISETEYNYEAISLVEPFKDIFTSFFFVSVGMLLNIGFMFDNFLSVISLVLLIVIVKFITTSIAVATLRFPLRTLIIVGFSLAQIGEFSLVLSKYSFDIGLISNDLYQQFLSVAVLSMAITPLIFIIGEKISEKIKTKNSANVSQNKNVDLVIIGYGLNGKNISIAAKSIGLNYSIIEMNPDTVKQLKSQENIIFGDASNESVLLHAGIDTAKTAVVVISDSSVLLKISKVIKLVNPAIHLIVRTRYVSDMQKLYEIGADDVIPEEFETSIELTARILNKFLVPANEIQNFIENLRNDHYKLLRNVDNKILLSNDFIDKEADFASVLIEKDSEYIGKSLKISNFREEKNISVIAIKRDKNWIINPVADEIFELNDRIILFGQRKDVNDFCKLKN